MVDLIKKERHKTLGVQVGNVMIGAGAPVVVQSMTNTDTADVDQTVVQIAELAHAGSEIVRMTVNTEEAAHAVPIIKEKLLQHGIDVPLVGDFHYNGHHLLTAFPACARALDKYRINPGNVGFGSKRDVQFEAIIDVALEYDKPVRIGVNWGSLDKAVKQRLMDENAKASEPKDMGWVTREALVLSALESAAHAETMGLSADKIILSCKVSHVQDLVAVYRSLAQRCDYALHLGLTEAGMGAKGIVASTAALSLLLQEGIGDTIRASLTPEPQGARAEEVYVCQHVLQALNLRLFRPQVSACPGCGRTTSDYFQHLSQDIELFIQEKMPSWQKKYPGVEGLKVAVMGCIVNGPGESKFADIGISLPGSGEAPVAPVFIDGEKAHTLRGEGIADAFKAILVDYIQQRFSSKQGSSSASTGRLK